MTSTAATTTFVATQSPVKAKHNSTTTYSVAQHKRTDSGTMEKVDNMARNLNEFKSFEQ